MLASGADFEFRGSIVVSIFACHAKTRIQFPARNAALCTCQRSSAQAGPDSAHTAHAHNTCAQQKCKHILAQLEKQRATRRTPSYSQNTELLAEHRTTRRTPNYSQNTELLADHRTTRRTPNYSQNTELPAEHRTTRRTPNYSQNHQTIRRTLNYSQNTELVAEHRITRRTLNCSQNTELPAEHPCLAELGWPFLNHLIN